MLGFLNSKKRILKKIELIREKAHINGKFSMFDTNYAKEVINEDISYNSLKTIFDNLNSWEDDCNIPYEVGESLNTFAKDNTVMIHRTNLGLNTNQKGLEYNESLVSIMRDGLKNYGHLNAGGGGAIINGAPPLTLTMTPLEGLSGFINLLGPYKSNDTIIITAFPKELVDKDGNLVKGHDYSEIYDFDENIPKVKNQYIVGAIIKKENSLDEFYTRDYILDYSKKEGVKYE